VQAPLGHAEEFCPDPAADAAAESILARLDGRRYLMHVGSCIPRKRVDFVLELFADVRTRVRDLRLLKVGGAWTPAQWELIRRLELQNAILHVDGISRSTLAVLYRRAAVVLLPSEAEGFGLPIVEALACGTPVLTTDLPVLREVGGAAVTCAPLANLDAWREEVLHLLTSHDTEPARARRSARVRLFSWREHTRIILETYRDLVA